jgi:hypothetical protein
VGRCAKKCLEKQFRDNPLGNRFSFGSMHSTIEAQLPQKVSKQKACQKPRKIQSIVIDTSEINI